MSEREVDNYIALVSSLLRLNQSQREQIGNELRDHLDTRVDALMGAGYSSSEATKMSLEEFGDAAGLAIQFVSIVHQQRRRWIMRFATFSIIGVFFLIVGAMAMWPGNANFGGPDQAIAQDDNPFKKGSQDSVTTAAGGGESARVKSSQNPKIRPLPGVLDARTDKALDEATDLDFQDTEFSNVVADIMDRHKIRIYLHESAVDAGLGPDDLVSIQFSGIRLRTALETFLDRFDCTYVIKDGMLVLATRDLCPYSVRIFNCTSILALMTEPGPSDIEKLIGLSGGGDGGVGGAAGGGGLGVGGDFERGGGADRGFGGDAASGGEQISKRRGRKSDKGSVPTKKTRLVGLIQSMVSPDSWRDSEGEGNIEMVEGVLIVRQRGPELHQIGELLESLQEQLKK